MKKPILRYFSILLLMICIISNEKSLAQTATFASLTVGLNSGDIPSGSSQKALYGFSVAVGGGSITFKTFYVGAQSNSSAFLTNGTLFRSPNSSFSAANPGTAVGNVTFGATATNSVTISNLSETVSSASGPTYYFIVADVKHTANASMNLYINWMTVGIDINNVSYSCQDGVYVGYNYTAGTPYPVSLTSTTSTAAGLTPSAISITSGATALKLFSFALTTTANSTFSALRINSSVANVGSYFKNFKLYNNSANDFSGATEVTGLTAGTSGSFVTFTTGGSTLSASTAATYYFLVADCTVTGTLPVNVQFSLVTGQASNALTRATPSVANYNTFTAFGNTYNINSASVAITSQQNGISSGTLTAGQKDITLFGFGVSASSNISASQFNINSTGAASTYFGNAKLYRNTTNSYASGVKTLVGTATFNDSYCNVVFATPEPISSTETYYFLVADNIGASASNPKIAFGFGNGQNTNAVVQVSPSASSYNTFNITGNLFTIPSPSVSYAVNTTGYTMPTTMVAGQTAVICGFTATPIGTITVTSPYINLYVSGADANSLFDTNGITVWVSTTGSYANATQVLGATYGNGGAGLKIALPGPLVLNAGTIYSYFIVAKTKAIGAATTRDIGSNGFMSDAGGNSYPTTIARASINFTTASVTITGNNSAVTGITQGALSYGQTGIVLFSFKLTAQGIFTMSKMAIPYVSSKSMGNYFTQGKVYRSTTSVFSNAQQVQGAGINFASGSAANITDFNQTFTAGAATTYYYFIVADLTASAEVVATTVTYNFTPSQNPTAINQGSGTGDAFNGFTTTDGVTHNIATVYKWVGGTSSDFSTLSNFQDIKGNTITSIGSTILIEVGVSAYTNAPTITAPTTIGGITFGTAVANPTLTIAAGKTLTLNNSISAINGVTAPYRVHQPASLISPPAHHPPSMVLLH